MRVLILADAFFASRERTLLSRLEIGLVDEGVRVIHGVPDGMGADMASVFSKVISYSPRTLAITRPLAARRMARDITTAGDAPGGDQALLDIVHVFGGSVWGLGAAVAHELGAALVLEVWRSGLAARARSDKWPGEGGPLFIAPDEVIERSLVETVGPGEAAVRLATWGVHAPPVLRPVLPEGATPSLMLVGAGRDAKAFDAALTGAAEVAREHPEMLIFCDALAARRAGLWRRARELNLLHRFTLIEELESRRDLLLNGSVLMQPEASGEVRSIILEAFASGMIVAAAADSSVSYLQDGRTARTITRNDATTWGAVLRDILGDRAKTRDLASNAYEYVRTRHRASDHVRAVLGAYSWLVGDGALPFSRPASYTNRD